MTDTITKSGTGFDSERYLRRVERERRLKEIEKTFQNIAEEVQQKQDDIYTKTFTEDGQQKALEDVELQDVKQPKKEHKNHGNTIFSRVSKLLTPTRTPKASFEIQSPTGVSSFPEIGPIGVAKSESRQSIGKPPVLKGNAKTSGPGVGARMGSARMQEKAVGSFFSVRKNSRCLLLSFFVVTLIVVLVVSIIDFKEKPKSRRTMSVIKDVFVENGISHHQLSTEGTAEYKSLSWLAEEIDSGDANLGDYFGDKIVTERDSSGAITSFNVAYRDVRAMMERFALLTIYYSTTSTGSGKWAKEDKWLAPGEAACNNWHGVKCKHINGGDASVEVVNSLDLADNKLSGTIPDVVSELLNLEYLLLGGNYLEGTVPEKLGELTNLQTLEISNNLLSGNVPKKVCKLKDDHALTKLEVDCGAVDFSCTCCTGCA